MASSNLQQKETGRKVCQIVIWLPGSSNRHDGHFNHYIWIIYIFLNRYIGGLFNKSLAANG